MNKRELKKQCDHIINYGPEGWGIVFLRESLKYQESWMRENKLKVREAKAKISAYKKAIKIAESSKK